MLCRRGIIAQHNPSECPTNTLQQLSHCVRLCSQMVHDEWQCCVLFHQHRNKHAGAQLHQQHVTGRHSTCGSTHCPALLLLHPRCACHALDATKPQHRLCWLCSAPHVVPCANGTHKACSIASCWQCFKHVASCIAATATCCLISWCLLCCRLRAVVALPPAQAACPFSCFTMCIACLALLQVCSFGGKCMPACCASTVQHTSKTLHTA